MNGSVRCFRGIAIPPTTLTATRTKTFADPEVNGVNCSQMCKTGDLPRAQGPHQQIEGDFAVPDDPLAER
jgi:hypothetical protein